MGYDRATIRTIAAAAGVDPALVHHFFGPKERLFASAMRLPMVPSDVVDAAFSPPAGAETGAGIGDHVLRTVLGIWDVPEARDAFLGLLRTAVTSDQAAAMLREYATQAILSRIAQVATAASGDSDGDFRAALAASQVLGLALARYVLQIGPIAQATNEDLAAAIGPTLDRYLTGNLLPGATGETAPPG